MEIGMAVAGEAVPGRVIYSTSGLGTPALVAFSIDAIVASGQVDNQSLIEAPAGLKFRPIISVTKNADGRTGGLLGLGGSF